MSYFFILKLFTQDITTTAMPGIDIKEEDDEDERIYK